MHLTLRTNHAMRLLMYAALNEGRVAPVSEIARACNMSEAHLAKIANTLADHGFVETLRGRGGGVRLGRPASEISVGAVTRVTETGACLVECLDARRNTCPLVAACRLRSVFVEAHAAFLAVLDRTSLADLLCDAGGLAAAMGLSPGAEAA
jgi:Rrf2 family nitric oxide-sensitive transcriptional repressor